MATAPGAQHVSLDEYLASEQTALERHDYLNGQLRAMTGGSLRHNTIKDNIAWALRNQLGSRPCLVWTSDQRVYVEATGLFTYPDVVVACEGPRVSDRDRYALTNPILVAEVLSPTTEAYDLTVKVVHYRRIPSLRLYLLIAQDRVHVEHYAREADGSWRLGETDDAAGVIDLPAVGCRLALADVYSKLDLLPDA